MIQLISFVLLFNLPAIADVKEKNAESGEWEQISHHDGIEVFKKEIPDSPVVAFKGQGIVDTPMTKLASILMDFERSEEWVDRLKDSKIIQKKSDLEFVIYNHIGTPIVMKDRDFVVLFRATYDSKKKEFHLKLSSVEDPSAPTTSYVRGKIIDSSYSLRSIDPDHTYIITEIHADPMGSVAKWVVNLFQKNWPRNTIQSLREQSQKSDIKENPAILELIHPTGSAHR